MMWILEDIIWPFSVIHTPFWFLGRRGRARGGDLPRLFIAIPVLRL